MNDSFIQSHLHNIAGMLAFIETADLERYVQSVSRNNSLYDAMGPILDPTEYRDTLHGGKHESAAIQLQIARKMLEIRQLMDTLP